MLTHSSLMSLAFAALLSAAVPAIADDAESLREQAAAQQAQVSPPAAPPAVPGVLPPFGGAGGPLFVGVDDTTVPAYRIDTTSSAATVAFSGFQVWGAAFDAVGDRILFNNGSTLYEWPIGGAVNTLGTIVDGMAVSQTMTGLAFHNGTLYACRNIANEAIYTINTTTLVASVFIDYVDADFDCGGLAVNPGDGMVYMTNDDATPLGSGLFRMNMDGSGTLITAYPAGQTDIDGLAIGDGRAYLVIDEPGSIFVWDFGTAAYLAPLTNPWTTSETFSAGAFIPAGAPNAFVSPTTLAGSQPTNTVTQQVLDIANTGAGTLDWTVFEQVQAQPAGTAQTPASAGPASPADEANGTEAVQSGSLPPSNPAARALARRLLGTTGLLLVPDSTNDRVMAFDPMTGNLVDANFIPSNAVVGTGIEAILAADGNSILLSDQIGDVVHRFDLDGNYLGIFAPAGGANTAILDNIRGIALDDAGNLLVTVGGGANQDAVARFDTAGNSTGNFIAPGVGGIDSPFDIYRRGSDWLVAGIDSDTIVAYNLAGAPIGVFAAVNTFPEQIAEAGNGNVLVANFSPGAEEGVIEFGPAGGAQIGRYDAPGLTGYRGVFELGNGNILTTTGAGVHEIDRAGNLVENKITGVSGRFITLLVAGPCSSAADMPWLSVAPTMGSTAAGATSNVTVSFDSTGLAPGSYSGNLCVSSNDPDAGPGNETELVVVPVSLEVTAGADLSVTLTDNPDPVAAGAQLSYTATVSNVGPSDAQDVQFSLPLPAGTSFVSATPSAGGSCNAASPVVCAWAGATTTAEVRTATIVAAVATNLANGSNLSATATTSSVTSDPNLANNTATADTVVEVQADLAVTLTDAPDPVIAGTQLTYTAVVSNIGPSDATGVVLSLPTPATTSFVSGSVSGGGACAGSPVVCTVTGSMLPNTSRTVTIVMLVAASAPEGSTISATATVTATSPDPVPGNNSATTTTAVITRADLLLGFSASVAQTLTNVPVTFTATSLNQGPSDAQGVSVTITLTPDFRYSSHTATGATCTTPQVGNTGAIICTWAGATAPGVTRTLTVVAFSNVEGATGVSASTTSSTIDPVPDNNSGNVVVQVGYLIEEIPTLSGYGLILLGLMFGLIGFVAVRRQA
jgi:uncharacterized repeat protein (TIGR01451 family)